jgi:hypothetical protein
MCKHICEPIHSTGRILPGKSGIAMCAENTAFYAARLLDQIQGADMTVTIVPADPDFFVIHARPGEMEYNVVRRVSIIAWRIQI